MRRLLVVTYYFPPSGGAGVQRVLKWVKYLPDFGVEPVVLTVEAGAYPKLDATLARDVPPGVPVHRTRALDPFGAYARLTGRTRQQAVAETTGHVSDAGTVAERVARWVRANFFLPDARVGWVPFAVQEGLRLLRGGSFDAVLTSGPPHSVHLTGWALHARTGTPWIADFRDPWTDINYYHELPHTPPARWIDAALERAVLRRATLVTTVGPSCRALLERRGLGTSAPIEVVQNGYDDADFEARPGPVSEEHFTLTYVGSLYLSRNPEALWRAIAELRRSGQLAQLRICVVGAMDPGAHASLVQHGLGEITEHIPYVPHDEATAYAQRAALLLLVIDPSPHNEIIITGKLYEYLASGRPVLALGPTHGDAAALLAETGAGQMLDREDIPAIQALLLRHYARWQEGDPVAGASAEAVRPYSRRAQAEVLAGLLGRIGRST